MRRSADAPAGEEVLVGLVVKAIRTRKCTANNKHKIAPGERLLEIKMPGPGSGLHPYCGPCATRMLGRARDDLDKITSDLAADD